MDLKGLSWTEIQEIKIAVEQHKIKQWYQLTERLKKNVSFKDMQRLKTAFNAERNRFTIEGRCNKILEIIQKLDLAIQEELESSQKSKSVVKK